MSQKTLIKQALLDGRKLTPLDALNEFGCFRLGARIYDLRQEGLPIEDIGGHHAIYQIPQEYFNSQMEMFG